ncbi:MAG TPA: hypothetical protein VFQ54_13300, partial [Thermomicrobiales bacterium]|nr:hypothetical protein [Thermomicrobiales bacterium]
AATVATMIHSSAFGDTNDVEDQIFVPIARAFDATRSVLDLLDAALRTASFNVDLLAVRAGEGGTTTTAIADGLVRDFGLSFRTAHHVVSRLVSEGDDITDDRVLATTRDVAGQMIDVPAGWTGRMLDPWMFVDARTIHGGPAPATVEAAIANARERLAADNAWIDGAAAAIAAAAVDRAARIDAFRARERVPPMARALL